MVRPYEEVEKEIEQINDINILRRIALENSIYSIEKYLKVKCYKQNINLLKNIIRIEHLWKNASQHKSEPERWLLIQDLKEKCEQYKITKQKQYLKQKNKKTKERIDTNYVKTIIKHFVRSNTVCISTGLYEDFIQKEKLRPIYNTYCPHSKIAKQLAKKGYDNIRLLLLAIRHCYLSLGFKDSSRKMNQNHNADLVKKLINENKLKVVGSNEMNQFIGKVNLLFQEEKQYE